MPERRQRGVEVLEKKVEVLEEEEESEIGDNAEGKKESPSGGCCGHLERMGDVLVNDRHRPEKPEKPPVPVRIEDATHTQEEYLASKAGPDDGQQDQQGGKQVRELWGHEAHNASLSGDAPSSSVVASVVSCLPSDTNSMATPKDAGSRPYPVDGFGKELRHSAMTNDVQMA